MTARGSSNKEVAGRLAISITTVETYKARAAEKLGLQSRAEITRYGAAQGWMEEAQSSVIAARCRRMRQYDSVLHGIGMPA